MISGNDPIIFIPSLFAIKDLKHFAGHFPPVCDTIQCRAGSYGELWRREGEERRGGQLLNIKVQSELRSVIRWWDDDDHQSQLCNFHHIHHRGPVII